MSFVSRVRDRAEVLHRGRSAGRVRAVLRLALVPLLASLLSACGGGAAGPSDPFCVGNADCVSGWCVGNRCADPGGDPDHDGLSSADEAVMDLDPMNPDTDGDEIPDGLEAGPDTKAPRDTDGDGRIDARESAVVDADLDCVPDQFDPLDDRSDATPSEVVRIACLDEGVCGLHPEGIVATCSDGVATCAYDAVPGWRAAPAGCGGPTGCDEDRCDGLDNDCDGTTDDGFSLAGVPLGRSCTAPGQCGSGLVECAAEEPTRTRCSTAPGGTSDASAAESCNGLDDDCDGLTDEDVAWGDSSLGQPCTGRGECGSGVVECRPDGTAGCSSDVGGSDDRSQAELCNLLDDDCDGDVDEDVDLGAPEAHCQIRGICADSPGQVVVRCQDGQPRCDLSGVPGWSGPEENRCDGLDDDCDGQLDEAESFRFRDPILGWLPLGLSCGVGACAGGVVECAADGSAGSCSTAALATPETCNGLDDDCDGAVDDGLVQAWSQEALRIDPGEPPVRAAAAVAWVPAGAAGGSGLWIYGGIARLAEGGAVLESHADLWRFDPIQHRYEAYGRGLPGPRSGARLLHDPSFSRLLLVGGLADAEASPVWAFDLRQSRWTEAGPAVRQDAVLAAVLEPGTRDLLFLRAEAAKRVLVLVRVPASGSDPAIEVATDLPWREDASAAADPATGRFYLVGGRGTDGTTDDVFWAMSAQGVVTSLATSTPLPPRVRHAVAVLPDGTLLVVGGDVSGGEPGDVAWSLSPGADEGAWRLLPVASPPSGSLLWPTLCAGSDAVWLVSGALKDGTGLRQLLRLDLASGSWSSESLIRRPPPRLGATLAVFPRQRSALLVGGTASDLHGDRPATDVWRLSLDGLTFEPFTAAGATLAPRGCAFAADAAQGILYVHGGGPDATAGQDADRLLAIRFDPGESEDLGAGPGPRRDHAMVWTGDSLVMVGGQGEGQRLSDAWRWFPSAGWSAIPGAGRPRAGHLAVWDAEAGRVVAVGGTAAGDVDALDPETGRWEPILQDARLVEPIQGAAFDADSRSILLGLDSGRVPAILDLGPPAALRSLPPAAMPPLRSPAVGYDPAYRRALFVGGAPVDPGSLRDDAPGSSLWVLPQGCPSTPSF